MRGRLLPMSIIIWELTVGDLFRVDDYWYRFRKIDGDQAVLDIVGSKDQKSMPLETEITELSVLSKK